MASYTEEQLAQARQQNIARQRQVQKRLQAGRGVNLYSANPLEAAIQGVGSFFGINQPPTAYASRLQGRDRLVVPSGWNDRSNMPNNVNVAGRTWDLAQQGSNAVYLPRGRSTQFNSVVSGSQGAPSPASPPPGGGGPAERAYREEVSRTAQLAAQNPELTRYEEARLKAIAPGATPEAIQSAEDIGMRIWAQKYGNLASKVKPGQAGYDAIQRTLNAGAMGSPMNFPFDSSNLLASSPTAPAPSYQGAVPATLTGVGSLPTNAFAGATATPYSNMLQGQTLQSAPLAVPSVQPTASYEGAQNLQGIGAPLTSDQFATDKARQLKDMYLKAALGTR